jgi:hypothetical protein
MSYDWNKNAAIVDRCWYFQYTIWTTTTLLGGLCIKDLLYIYNNFHADKARSRIPRYALLYLLSNSISYWFNIYPLTKEEKRQQWVKFRYVGKLVYGLTFLELEEDRKKWESLKASGAVHSHGHH